METTSTNSKERNPTASSHVSVRRIELDRVKLPTDRGEHDSTAVGALASSISLIGLQTPISIDADYTIVAGCKRYLAAKQLGMPAIDCFVIEDKGIHQLWRLSENLHRSTLTALERSTALIQWAEATDKDAQLEQVSGGRGKQGGAAKAARTLGVDRNALRRAAQIASIPPAARAAITAAGLDDNQSALLAIAAVPQSEQLAKVEEFAASRADRGSVTPAANEAEFRALARAWEKANDDARARFMAEIVDPYRASANSA
ncbi:ParB/RepB/Spo0J family partition protein [Bradyrhizobium sp. CCBAU 25338]|uniref:ParB/RepB/Spo0J family partition protein n=1 Tax=Bradyrhizobium sp. CCBAU 25338 TaxID=1641877 RepID=UPI002302B2B2|nr:ParB N-terminal domain-containing protein [Bradyrhizobium sp. CCBAU 25338]MDA9530049.1 hypothetical protein [Bradyrhizobium sp. CCBAU 25338]